MDLEASWRDPGPRARGCRCSLRLLLGRRPEGARKTLFDRLQRYEGPGAVEVNDLYVAMAHEELSADR